jgi:hypothetical protein
MWESLSYQSKIDKHDSATWIENLTIRTEGHRTRRQGPMPESIPSTSLIKRSVDKKKHLFMRLYFPLGQVQGCWEKYCWHLPMYTPSTMLISLCHDNVVFSHFLCVQKAWLQFGWHVWVSTGRAFIF